MTNDELRPAKPTTIEHWMTTGLLGAPGAFQRAAREYAEEYAAMAVAAAAAALGEPVNATIEVVDEPGAWTPVAWITNAGRLCLQDGDGPVKAMPHMNEDCDFITPLYDRHTVADLGRTARALAVHVSEVRHAALRALVAWDGTVLPKAHDGLMQERMEDLRAALGPNFNSTTP